MVRVLVLLGLLLPLSLTQALPPEHDNNVWLKILEFINEKMDHCGGSAHVTISPYTNEAELRAAGWILVGKTTFELLTNNQFYWKEAYKHPSHPNEWIERTYSYDGMPSHHDRNSLMSCSK